MIFSLIWFITLTTCVHFFTNNIFLIYLSLVFLLYCVGGIVEWKAFQLVCNSAYLNGHGHCWTIKNHMHPLSGLLGEWLRLKSTTWEYPYKYIYFAFIGYAQQLTSRKGSFSVIKHTRMTFFYYIYWYILVWGCVRVSVRRAYLILAQLNSMCQTGRSFVHPVA